MDLNNLKDENTQLEYKKNKEGLSQDIWETISAFENTSGGTIILGVTEKKRKNSTTYKVNGVKDSHTVIEDFWSTINKKISHVTITNEDVSIIEYAVDDNKLELIEIKVPEAPDSKKPVMANGSAFLRKGSLDKKLKTSSEEFKKLILNSKDDLDTEVLTNYSIDELDLETVQDYKNLIDKRNDRFKNLDLPDFLEHIGVISKDFDNDSNKKGITVGGLLFFGKTNAIISKFPHFQLDYFDKSDTNPRWKKRISSVSEDLNIFSFFRKTQEALYQTVDDSFQIDNNDLYRKSSEPMRIALREALINTLMHANYFESGIINITNHINYYIFSNPGKMKVPKESFFTSTKSKYRNPIISKLFVLIGLGERAGQGGEKIFESAQVNSYRNPEIDTGIDGTNLKIWKIDYADSFSNKKITPRQRQIVKVILTEHVLSNKEIQDKTGLSRSIISRELKKLVKNEIIEVIGKGPSTKYTIKMSKEQFVALANSLPEIIKKTIS